MYAKLRFVALGVLSSIAAASVNPPSGWTYQGCYSDSTYTRWLTGYGFADSSSMSYELCTQTCFSAGYAVAGVEYGDECYCGYQLSSNAIKEPDTDCNMKCSGNSIETCGGSYRLTVFSRNNASVPVTNPGPSGWTSLGCYLDSKTFRTLQNPVTVTPGMTVAGCTAKCQQLGYQYAGAEYGNECWCDDTIHHIAIIQPENCEYPCSSNSSEYCGGSNALNMYKLPAATSSNSLPSGWTSLGCYTDSVSARALATSSSVPGGASNMTIEGCLNTCHASGYSFAGLEYSQECWCDNKHGGSPASDQTTCNMHCTGNSAEVCGGSNRLNMYQYNATLATATTSIPAPTSTSSTTSTAPTPTSTYSCTSNSIQDGGFESGIPPTTSTSSGPSPWSISSIIGSTTYGLSRPGYNSAYAFNASLVPTYASSGNSALTLKQTFSTCPGMNYTIEFYYMFNQTIGNNCALKIEYVYNANAFGSEAFDGQLSGQQTPYWFKEYALFQAVATTSPVVFTFSCKNYANNFIYLDTVTLSPNYGNVY